MTVVMPEFSRYCGCYVPFPSERSPHVQHPHGIAHYSDDVPCCGHLKHGCPPIIAGVHSLFKRFSVITSPPIASLPVASLPIRSSHDHVCSNYIVSPNSRLPSRDSPCLREIEGDKIALTSVGASLGASSQEGSNLKVVPPSVPL